MPSRRPAKPCLFPRHHPGSQTKGGEKPAPASASRVKPARPHRRKGGPGGLTLGQGRPSREGGDDQAGQGPWQVDFSISLSVALAPHRIHVCERLMDTLLLFVEDRFGGPGPTMIPAPIMMPGQGKESAGTPPGQMSQGPRERNKGKHVP